MPILCTETKEATIYEIRDVGWTPLYAAIGEFVVAFERMVSTLRFNSGCILQRRGLDEWALSEALLTTPQIGPEGLVVAYCAFFNIITDDQALRRRASTLVTKVKTLTEHRNMIVHGEWLVGPDMVFVSDSPELPERHGIKRKPSKTGVSVKEQPSLDELKILNAQCWEAKVEVQQIFTDWILAEYKKSAP